jgi:hypothetical protein
MKGLPDIPKVELASFRPLPPATGEEIDVHFNPTSLQYTVSNTLKEEGSGSSKKQFVDKTSAKLTMQVVFDTTDTGVDVRTHTDKMAALLRPVAQGKKQVPPNVEFGWGAYRFTGMVEQYKETLDFFSPGGVPLRATVDLTLASQDVQFTSAKNPPAKVDQGGPEPAVVPGGGSPSGVASSLGDPRAARAIAAANGSASLRFGGGAGLAVGADVELRAEAAFSAGAAAGIGIGGGAGVGIGGAAGMGVGGAAAAGFGVGGGASFAGAGFGASAPSASASFGRRASVSIGGAAGGAFAGLRTTVSSPSTMPSASAAIAKAGAGVSGSAGTRSAGADAHFGPGGQARAQAGASLGADVGAEADLNALIRFS